MTNYVLRRKYFGECLEIIEQESTTGLKVLTNLVDQLPTDGGIVFRWGCTATIPNVHAFKMVNKANAIHETTNKREFRLKMSAAGLAPPSYGDFEEMFEQSFENKRYLVRPATHTRSEGMEVCNTIREVYRACRSFKEGYYISEIIEKDAEYRVFFCSGRCLGVLRKIPKDASEVSWGCVEEGQFKYIDWSDWPMHVVRKALNAINLSSLDFGAVDIITKGQEAYCLEINTAPGLTPYWVRKHLQAFDYIVKNGRDHIAAQPTSSFHGYIHPALTSAAKVA